MDVSLIESVLAVTESLIPEYGADGTVRERTGSSLPGIAPSNTYDEDGRYLVRSRKRRQYFPETYASDWST